MQQKNAAVYDDRNLRRIKKETKAENLRLKSIKVERPELWHQCFMTIIIVTSGSHVIEEHKSRLMKQWLQSLSLLCKGFPQDYTLAVQETILFMKKRCLQSFLPYVMLGWRDLDKKRDQVGKSSICRIACFGTRSFSIICISKRLNTGCATPMEGCHMR